MSEDGQLEGIKWYDKQLLVLITLARLMPLEFLSPIKGSGAVRDLREAAMLSDPPAQADQPIPGRR